MKKMIHARDRELLEINKELENQVRARTAELEYRNNELNAYNYSVSHDLRTPLRSIDGFSMALLEDCEDQLNESGKDYLHRIRKSAQRMGELIDDMLQLSAITRAEIRCELVNLSELANTVFNNLKEQQPERQVEIVVKDNITAEGDRKLLQIVLENLLGNAWKYSSTRQEAVIEFGEMAENSKHVFYIKDNGAGFNMQYANKLFGVFQRLHGSDYEGTGIGLATVKRVIERHGGKVWAKAKEGTGATFYFTLA
jgi:light-regulated signal transduction histidine kinase (bacteriophytochrome)